MKRRMLRLTLLALTIMSLFVVAAPAASASAQSCVVPANGGYVCNYTHGDGAYVSEIEAIRVAPETCNYSADASVLDYNGRVKWFQHLSGGLDCSPVRAWLRFYPNQTFALGDETSVLWYTNGEPVGGYANVVLS